MTLDNVLKIVLAGGSLTAGAFLTAVRARLTNIRQKKRQHGIFYVFGGLVIMNLAKGPTNEQVAEYRRLHKPINSRL